FQAKDGPEFRPAKIIVLATQAAGAVVAVVLFGYYVWANKRKDRKEAAAGLSEGRDTEADAWNNRTDKENKSFSNTLNNGGLNKTLFLQYKYSFYVEASQGACHYDTILQGQRTYEDETGVPGRGRVGGRHR
ncbi:hypothetical protein V491_01213, partial [Pseudogymnoascus sp. VKM F-3775]